MTVHDVEERLTQIEHLNKTGQWPNGEIPAWVAIKQHGVRLGIDYCIKDFYEKAVPLLLGEIKYLKSHYTYQDVNDWDDYF